MKSANETSRHHFVPEGARHALRDKASLSSIRRSMRADLSSAGVDDAVTFDCLVAVSEACSNALIHGRSVPDESDPVVSWRIEPSCLSFLIQDFAGREWSKTAHPSREAAEEPLPEGRVGGYGIGLMTGLMDSVDIGYRSGGTMVTMIKNLEGRGSTSP